MTFVQDYTALEGTVQAVKDEIKCCNELYSQLGIVL